MGWYFVASFLFCTAVCLAQQQERSYVSDSTTNFANPERGFYRFYGTKDVNDSQGATPITASTLKSYREANVTLVYRGYYLKSFCTSSLSQEQLNLISSDFATLRNSGFKCVLRFAYRESTSECEPVASIIDTHLTQLTPILRANADVIAVMQAGFIGLWGEWHTSALANNGNFTWIINRITSILPSDRSVQVRTPLQKKNIFGISSSTLSLENSFPSRSTRSDSNSRTGHHNDCFLASDTDMGTYSNITADRSFLQSDTQFVPNGGETCAKSSYTKCSNALIDLAKFHFSFLNLDYHPQVIAQWKTENCFDKISISMGYRLSLTKASIPSNIPSGGSFTYSLSFANNGFAAPFNPYQMQLALFASSANANATTTVSYSWNLNHDLRRMTPEQSPTVASGSLTVPDTIALGSYRVVLCICDIYDSLKSRTEFCIRLANSDIAFDSSGYQDLGMVVQVTKNVSESSPLLRYSTNMLLFLAIVWLLIC